MPSRALLATLLLILPASADAQSPMQAILDMLRTDNAWTVAQQRSICEIPAPPFQEAARASEFKRRFESLGLAARIDSEGNVHAVRAGSGSGTTIVVTGHLDTVFPEGTDVRVRSDSGRMRGPGISDDCRGLAVVLAIARAFQRVDPRHDARIIFMGNVGEEGPGNLRGVRHLYERELKGQIDYFISVDGAGLNFIPRAVGSHRYKVTYSGPGGHSYGAFGIPNPVHALGRAVAKISDLQVPASPKVTFNVGVIDGGTSVNSIAFDATMEVDMRSEDAAALRAIDARIQHAFKEALDEENARWQGDRARAARLRIAIDTIGIRPTGAQPDSARIVQIAFGTARTLGFFPSAGAASTDANIPISLGLPGIAVSGGGRAGGAHALNEWYEDGPNGYLGPQWVALMIGNLAGVAGAVAPAR